MNYEAFLDKAAMALQACLDKDPEIPVRGARVGIKSVSKLQGGSYRGLCVDFPGGELCASFNAGPYYQSFMEGKPLEDLVPPMLDQVRLILSRDDFSMDWTDLSYRSCRERLMLEVISFKKNEDQLRALPHRRIEDLALVYRLDFGTRGTSNASALITHSLLAHFGLEEEALYHDAMEIVPKKNPLVLRPLAETLRDLGDFPSPAAADTNFLYLASNQTCLMGASVLAYPDFGRRVLEVLGEDFYILPSSIHEVLVLPVSREPIAPSLPEIVRSVNRFQVAPEDVLSDNVYHYRAGEDRIRLADLPGNPLV